jgi:hypothetical protein
VFQQRQQKLSATVVDLGATITLKQELVLQLEKSQVPPIADTRCCTVRSSSRCLRRARRVYKTVVLFAFNQSSLLQSREVYYCIAIVCFFFKKNAGGKRDCPPSHTHTHAHMHTHAHTRTRAHTHALTHTRTHTRSTKRTRTHTHTHARAHTRTHTRTHARARAGRPSTRR